MTVPRLGGLLPALYVWSYVAKRRGFKVMRRCMSRWAATAALVAAGLLLTGPAAAREPQITDNQVRERIIAESIRAYPGACACPYSTMRNGRNCGRRSAYSKPGGRAPICYAEDVTEAMVARWRRGR